MIKFLNYKNIILFILIILIFTNIITAAVIFLDINIIESPKTDIIINIIDINSEELILELQLEMYNPNNFEISIEELKVISLTDDNYKIGEIEIGKGTISSDKTKLFSSIEEIKFQETSDFSILKNTISGKIGVIFFGIIKKTIPIELSLTTSLDEIIEDIKIPDITLEFYFDDITNKGLIFTTGINFYNPNNIGLTIDKLKLNATNDNNENVGNFTIIGGTIKPKDYSFFTSKGMLSFDLIDTNELNLNLSGVASIQVAGLNKSISLSTEMKVSLPDIQDFIFQNESIKFYIPVQFKLTLNGIKTNVGLKYYNPSNITLVTRNVTCSIFRVDDDLKTEIGLESMESCIINPKEEVCIQTEIVIPYINYLKAGNWRLLPDWIVLTIEGDFAIAGTRQAVPLSLNAYVNPNLFKNSEFSE